MGKKHFKKFISAICVMAVLCCGVLTLSGNVSKAFDTESLIPVSLVKSDSGNPMLGFDENGDIDYYHAWEPSFSHLRATLFSL